MEIVADLHLHSKYSRAVSNQMTLPTIAEYAKKKGLNLLTVCDWTHPLWFKEIKTQIEEVSEGVYQLKSQNANLKSVIQNSKVREPRFIFSTEIACIYSQGGKTRRVHALLFVPSIEVAEKVNKELMRHGVNLMADGRPIMGLSVKDVLEIMMGVDEGSFLIPAHVWTPHFGVYGSASGFDSLEEAFGTMAKYIYGIETGLSSDPVMNWQVKELENRSILSFSDAHSPAKMGREATVFELAELTYENVRKAIMDQGLRLDARNLKLDKEAGGLKVEGIIQPQSSRSQDLSSSFNSRPSTKILYTIEFYPEEGKYHYSGHRNCNVVQKPEETVKNGLTCSVCKRRMTEGVMYRVEQVASTKQNAREAISFYPEMKPNSAGLVWKLDTKRKRPPYVSLVPLLEVIAESLTSSVNSVRAKEMYEQMIRSLGTELDILLLVAIQTIANRVGGKIAEGIAKVRSGTMVIEPGYDGVYGVVKIWNHEGSTQGVQEGEQNNSQLGLF